MNGPSVNLSVLDMLDSKWEVNDLSKMINIGSCSQHTVHGTLKVGATKAEWGIDKILKALFWILATHLLGEALCKRRRIWSIST